MKKFVSGIGEVEMTSEEIEAFTAQQEADSNQARPIPTSVTPRQARLALLSAGLLDQVESAVTAAGGATKIAWEYATVINRDDPLIISISSSLGLTAEQIDALIAHAATL